VEAPLKSKASSAPVRERILATPGKSRDGLHRPPLSCRERQAAKQKENDLARTSTPAWSGSAEPGKTAPRVSKRISAQAFTSLKLNKGTAWARREQARRGQAQSVARPRHHRGWRATSTAMAFAPVPQSLYTDDAAVRRERLDLRPPRAAESGGAAPSPMGTPQSQLLPIWAMVAISTSASGLTRPHWMQ
jgi:hypothetical protein